MVKPVRQSVSSHSTPSKTNSNLSSTVERLHNPAKSPRERNKSSTTSRSSTISQRISKTPPPMISPSLVTSLSSPRDKTNLKPHTQSCCQCKSSKNYSSTAATQTVNQVRLIFTIIASYYQSIDIILLQEFQMCVNRLEPNNWFYRIHQQASLGQAITGKCKDLEIIRYPFILRHGNQEPTVLPYIQHHRPEVVLQGNYRLQVENFQELIDFINWSHVEW